MNFEVIEHDALGQSVRCSYCTRAAKRVVVIPLTKRPGIEEAFVSSDGDLLWIGLCAHCVLEMARALESARGPSPA